LTRTLWPPAAFGTVVTVAVIAAGCGGPLSSNGKSTATAADTSNNTNTTTDAHTATANHTTTTSAREKAVKYAECLRANGVSDFPDPNASGESPSYGVSVTPTVWRSATTACKALAPPGAGNAKLTQAQLSDALRFAQCVREHGVPDFPDPVNGQPLIDTTKIPSANKPGGMTILNAATHTCGHLIAQDVGGK
jgi:hypothetical protein